MSAQPIDILTAAQDDLLAALLAGQIKTKDLPTAYKTYRAELLAAGFSASEAINCFWDAVHTAEHTLRHDSSVTRAAELAAEVSALPPPPPRPVFHLSAAELAKIDRNMARLAKLTDSTQGMF